MTARSRDSTRTLPMRMHCLALLFAAGWLLFGSTASGEKPAELPLVFEDQFKKGIDRWEPTDAKAWKIVESAKGNMLSQFAQSKYKPPHRSPYNLSLIKDVTVGDFVLDAQAQSTGKDGPH